MILLNFSHPLTPAQQERVEQFTAQQVEQLIDVPTQFDEALPFAPQVTQLLDAVNLSRAEWQQLPILIVPPALSVAAVTLLADLHGRMGYFPLHLRMRRAAEAAPLLFEAAEVLNLQLIRDRRRAQRFINGERR